jgi:hypothetical protein
MGRTEGYANFDFKVPPRIGMGFTVLERGDPFLNNLKDEQNGEIVDLPSGAYTTVTIKMGLSYLATRRLSLGASIGLYLQSMPTGVGDNGRLEYSSPPPGIGGLDIAAQLRLRDDWVVSAIARNLNAAMRWEVASEGLNVTIDDRPSPQFFLASRLDKKFMTRPLVWVLDLEADLFDGEFNALPRPEGRISSGLEWRGWDHFCVRAGLGDLVVGGMILSDSREYWRTFAMRITAGFGLDLPRLRPGLRVNYALSTDKVWAGIDQVLDVTYEF